MVTFRKDGHGFTKPPPGLWCDLSFKSSSADILDSKRRWWGKMGRKKGKRRLNLKQGIARPQSVRFRRSRIDDVLIYAGCGGKGPPSDKSDFISGLERHHSDLMRSHCDILFKRNERRTAGSSWAFSNDIQIIWARDVSDILCQGAVARA